MFSRASAVFLDGLHPTAKTVALIAADRCGRRVRLIEIDPLHCDMIIRASGCDLRRMKSVTCSSHGADQGSITAAPRARKMFDHVH